MIISKVIGGLGNQMFQYAAGRSISLDLNHDLMLDIDAYRSYGLHNGYELDRVFNISPKIASNLQVATLLGIYKNRYLAYTLKRAVQFGLPSPKNIIQEKSFGYDRRVKKIKSDTYLDGYWQSEKYFIENASQIRSDFVFRLNLSYPEMAVRQSLLETNSISLHIRRGDYVSNHAVAKRHGLCSLDYYYSAIELIGSKVPNPFLFVFSDDLDWARENLKTSLPIRFMGSNIRSDSYKDMYFMSQCKHNIIANSSFSWWGAWLNANPNKLVICPKRWFLDNSDISSLIPNNWKLL
jgi:hypothetical protein